MKPTYIRQPYGSKLCGQTCVAMAAGVTLQKAVIAFGTRGSTTGKAVLIVLRRLGVNTGDRYVREHHSRTEVGLSPIVLGTGPKAKGPLPPRCIVKARNGTIKGLAPKWARRSHWMLWWDGELYDPDPPCSYGYISGYIEIKEA